MAEYIEREQAREVICGWCEYDSCPGYDYYWDKCDAKRRLGDIPSADVQPVVHGHWIQNYETDDGRQLRCSECGMVYWVGKGRDGNYCPNCGADMRGVDNDNKPN